MTLAHLEDGFDDNTCLCCMCRCGYHKCFQQMASKLPLSIQHELNPMDFNSLYRPDREAKVTVADLCGKTTYQSDFCGQQELTDRYPLEHNKLETHLSLHCGDIARQSTYSNDYIPWSRDDQELYRAKLHVPDYMLQGITRDEYDHDYQKVGVYNYYCPSHCAAIEKEETKENYRGGRITPSLFKPARKDYLSVEKASPPMTAESCYRSAFTCPLENMNSYEGLSKNTHSTLKVGDGPMQEESTSMMDYHDPDVSSHMPVRRVRDVYKPPQCRMETTTTTGRAYPEWKVFRSEVKPLKFVETDYRKNQLYDVQRLELLGTMLPLHRM